MVKTYERHVGLDSITIWSGCRRRLFFGIIAA